MIVTTAVQCEVVHDLSIGAMFTDLERERPITHISRSRQYSMLKMSLAVSQQETYLGLQWITIMLHTLY